MSCMAVNKINDHLNTVGSEYRAVGHRDQRMGNTFWIEGPNDFMEVYDLEEVWPALEACNTAEEVDTLFRTGGLAL